MRLFLSFVPILGCAGVMVLCVRMMRGHGQEATSDTERRIANLEEENARMREEIARQPETSRTEEG